MRVRILAHALVVLVLTGLAVGWARQAEPQYAALQTELARLQTEAADARAQNAIRGLMHAYGRLIDARDWDGFAALWTNDAAYAAGPGRDPLKGGPAIASFLRNVISSNPAGIGAPNFHVFFNEEIQVTGEKARATSMSTFIAPAASGAPVMVVLARYEDEYVLEDAGWKFQSRIVHGKLPARQPQP